MAPACQRPMLARTETNKHSLLAAAFLPTIELRLQPRKLGLSALAQHQSFQRVLSGRNLG